jgi:hypothetical protein
VFCFGGACRHRFAEAAAARLRGDQGWTVDGRHRPQPGTRRQSAGECPVSETLNFRPRGRCAGQKCIYTVHIWCALFVFGHNKNALVNLIYTNRGAQMSAHGAAALNVNMSGLIPKKSMLHTLVTIIKNAELPCMRGQKFVFDEVSTGSKIF